MIAKKCDSCGALYEVYNTKNDDKKINGIFTLNIDERQEYFSHGPYDLCPECIIPIKNLLKLDCEKSIKVDDSKQYNPVSCAYNILLGEICKCEKNPYYLIDFGAIQQSIGYLGEVLDD